MLEENNKKNRTILSDQIIKELIKLKNDNKIKN
jgi:hypothetical protein